MLCGKDRARFKVDMAIFQWPNYMARHLIMILKINLSYTIFFYEIQKCNFGPCFVPSATVSILVPLNNNYDM